jgi:4-hydroxybenzoate polyprenyltransferase
MEDLLKKINSFKEFIRWNDWAIDKLPVFFTACFYLILKQPVISHIFILDFFIFVVFISCTAVYGYLINNFADLDIDLKQGKKNSLSNFSRTSQILIILLTLAGVLVSGVYFHFYILFITTHSFQGKRINWFNNSFSGSIGCADYDLLLDFWKPLFTGYPDFCTLWVLQGGSI